MPVAGTTRRADTGSGARFPEPALPLSARFVQSEIELRNVDQGFGRQGTAGMKDQLSRQICNRYLAQPPRLGYARGLALRASLAPEAVAGSADSLASAVAP